MVQERKGEKSNLLKYKYFFGRDGVIRTLDPLHPMQVRYQAALRPDKVETGACFKSWRLYISL